MAASMGVKFASGYIFNIYSSLEEIYRVTSGEPMLHHDDYNTESNDPVFSFFNQQIIDGRKEFKEKWSQSMKFDDSVDNFTFHRILGAGSFGQVLAASYKGVSTHLPKNVPLVAVKILKKADIMKSHQVDHTLNEKKVSICMHSDFITKTYMAFKDKVHLYFVMEFMPGGEFYLFLRQKGRFGEAMSQFYASQVTLALQYMHGLHVIYRDLKPENILIGHTGYIKLGDFGFAKICPGKTWTLCGTPQYMAPELLVNKSYGKAVDCWGLGILIYEMCSGTVPFDDANTMKMYEKIVACNTVYPKGFSKELVDLLGSLIQADVTKRFGNLKDGMYDVIRHVWFKNVDFIRIYKQQYKPPWTPNSQSIVEKFSKNQTQLKFSKSGKQPRASWSKEFEEF